MRIELIGQNHVTERGFFSYLFLALIKCKGARFIDAPRPTPEILSPRPISGAWVFFDSHRVFFDMSDHVFLLDLDALTHCELYFKANLCRTITDKILSQVGMASMKAKILPFVWFAPTLEMYNQNSIRNRLSSIFFRRHWDICHIVGVYENLKRQCVTSIFETNNVQLKPHEYHFWIRYHLQNVLRQSGLKGYYRLTSRGNRDIEDNVYVFPNLTERSFMQKMQQSSLTVINTLPHALLPWKAFESLALGHPFIVERAPLVEIPEPFQLEAGKHFLELMPGFGSFDEEVDVDNPRSYRILQAPTLNDLNSAVTTLVRQIRDPAIVSYMTKHAMEYGQTVLKPEFVTDYICEKVRLMVH